MVKSLLSPRPSIIINSQIFNFSVASSPEPIPTSPLGYPRPFDRTILAEVGVCGGEEKGTDPIVSAGISLRQQVGYQNVLDIGLQSDIAGGDGERDDVRFVVGYSTAFCSMSRQARAMDNSAAFSFNSCSTSDVELSS